MTTRTTTHAMPMRTDAVSGEKLYPGMQRIETNAGVRWIVQGSGPRNHSRSYVGTFATHGAAAHAALSARAKACEEEAARLRVQAAQLRAQAKQYKRGAPLRNTGRPTTKSTTN